MNTHRIASLLRGTGALLLAMAALPASAQLLSSFSAEPVQARAGEAVRFTLDFDVTGGTNCGVHVYWGDGQTTTFKINQAKDVPLVTTHTYAKPGTYKVVAEGKRVEATFKCGGKNLETQVTVAPMAVAATGARPAAPAVCPEGWTLAKPGVNKKTGAYTCTARAGTALPAARATCPGDLSYFENARKAQLGCKP